MIERIVFLLMILISLYTVFTPIKLSSVVGRTALSILAVLLYVVLSAPDVAIAEALLGALLTTLVYITALKSRSEVKIGFVPVRLLFEKLGDAFSGFEYELLKSFCEKYDYKMGFVEFSSIEELLDALNEEKIDIGCGGIFREDNKGYLKTKIFYLEDGKLDLLRYVERKYRGEDLSHIFQKDGSYHILFTDDELKVRFREFLRTEKNLVERLKKRYFGEEKS
ncbi:hydrogenase subunit MbhD domain-containing protein [Thermotoga sp. KOL6]|uniref:hydrogenase subunit MbhD domain-containing protein n=1 Tax=Thermotoga sp. KOL6 TaxID=126741 RepID=UPI000C784095|nr:Na(+)/H(+) antiporter subunit B [Thermotoga sp. KOL6]PLV59846.1 sodium:proton antiporter [Thermotoga sp. KOL6]